VVVHAVLIGDVLILMKKDEGNCSYVLGFIGGVTSISTHG